MQTLSKSDEQWKQELTPEQYDVLRCSATEAPFMGAYWNTKEKGMYLCSGCGQELFSSDTKFDSGSGCHLVRPRGVMNARFKTEIPLLPGLYARVLVWAMNSACTTGYLDFG